MSKTLSKLQDWTFTVDYEGIAWAVFDRKGESMNSLGRRPTEELDQIVKVVEEAKAGEIKGLVLISGKDSSFIAGADITQLHIPMQMFLHVPPVLINRTNPRDNHKAIRASPGYGQIRLDPTPFVQPLGVDEGTRFCRYIPATEPLQRLLGIRPGHLELAKRGNVVDTHALPH